MSTVLRQTALERLGPWTKAFVVTTGILAISLLSWWALADPRWALLGLYPQPLGTLLFWTILANVILGFNFKLWPFESHGRPVTSVLLYVVATVVVAFLAVSLLNHGLGRIDPTFASSASDGAGYAASAYIVLIGFLAFGMMAAVWDDWPWRDAEVNVPLLGVAEFLTGFALTVVGYVLLAYPNFAPWGGPAHPENVLMSLPVATGWFYSAIVAQVLATQLWGNWPWVTFRRRWQQALIAVLAIFAFGTIFFFAVRELLLPLLVPGEIALLDGWSADLEVAQFGVCVVMWSLFWGLIFGRWPTHLGEMLDRLARTFIVLLLSVVTYLVYNRLVGTVVLHEPALAGNYGGNPLLGLDWVILFLFWYVLGLRVYRTRRSAETGPSGPQTTKKLEKADPHA